MSSTSSSSVTTMRWQRLLAIGLIVIGLVLVGLFSARTVISYSSIYWRQISRRSQTVNQP